MFCILSIQNISMDSEHMKMSVALTTFSVLLGSQIVIRKLLIIFFCGVFNVCYIIFLILTLLLPVCSSRSVTSLEVKKRKYINFMQYCDLLEL
jgi:hypothetical protein